MVQHLYIVVGMDTRYEVRGSPGPQSIHIRQYKLEALAVSNSHDGVTRPCAAGAGLFPCLCNHGLV